MQYMFLEENNFSMHLKALQTGIIAIKYTQHFFFRTKQHNAIVQQEKAIKQEYIK